MKGTATLTSKGQITIPKPIREALSLKKKDRLIFSVIEDGLIAVKTLKKDFLGMGGSVPPLKKPEDFEKVREKVAKKIAESVVEEGK